MESTITVTGVGKASVKPDLAIVSFRLKSRDADYEKMMKNAAKNLTALQKAIGSIGFEETDLKTISFNVDTEYRSVPDKKGNRQQIFEGFVCRQKLKLEFDFDTTVLSRVISAITKCISEPELKIEFSVKDEEAVKDAMLENAALNAKRRAEVITKAVGAKLCEIVSINFSWAELDIFSPTRFELRDECLGYEEMSPAMNIAPDNIEVEDSVTFIWKIA